MLINIQGITICQGEKTVLKDATLQVDKSEFVYIIGKVGSGKSSLLKTIYAELGFKGGHAQVLDFDMSAIKRKQVPDLRRQLGVVFQDFQLLRNRTIAGNLDFVLRATGWKRKAERQERIETVLNLVELPDAADRFPHELSGGEQQRICIARAMLNNPKIILADEPTGNLDHETSCKIVKLLRSFCEQDTAVVMVTHNLTLLNKYPGIVYECKEGELLEMTETYNKPAAKQEDL